jgi:hypothetical protein
VHVIIATIPALGHLNPGLAWQPERAALSGLDRIRWDIENVFVNPIPGQAW